MKVPSIQVTVVALSTGSLLILSVFGSTPRARIDPASSELSVDPQRIDLGVVSQGKQVPFSFAIRNNTPHRIEKLSIRPTCGCTLLDPIHHATLEAHNSLLIKGVLDANRTRGQKATHVLVSWMSENPKAMRIVTIEADVLPVIKVIPDSFEFDTGEIADRESVRTEKVQLFSTAGIPFTIVDVRWTHPALKVTTHTDASDVQAAQRASLDITFNPQYPNLPALAGSCFIDVQTCIPSEPVIRIPVKILASDASNE